MRTWKCPCCAYNNPPNSDLLEELICSNCKNKFDSNFYTFESKDYIGSDVGWEVSDEWWDLYNQNREKFIREKTRQENEKSKNQTVSDWLKHLSDIAQAMLFLLLPFLILMVIIFMIVKTVKWFWLF